MFSFSTTGILMTLRIELQPKLDLRAANSLVDALRHAAGADVILDASKVSHLGTLCLQALIAAAKDHKTEGTKFVLERASDTFINHLAIFGFSIETFAEDAA